MIYKPFIFSFSLYVSSFYKAHNVVQRKEAIETELMDRCKEHHVEIGNFIEKVTRLENVSRFLSNFKKGGVYLFLLDYYDD